MIGTKALSQGRPREARSLPFEGRRVRSSDGQRGRSVLGQKATFTGHFRPKRSGVFPLRLSWGFPIFFAERCAAIIGYPRSPPLHVLRPSPFRMACAPRYGATCAIADDAAWAAGGMAGQPDHLQCEWHAQRGDDHAVFRQSRRLRRRPRRHAVLPGLRGPGLQPSGSPGRVGFRCGTGLAFCRPTASSVWLLPTSSQVPGARSCTSGGVAHVVKMTNGALPAHHFANGGDSAFALPGLP